MYNYTCCDCNIKWKIWVSDNQDFPLVSVPNSSVYFIYFYLRDLNLSFYLLRILLNLPTSIAFHSIGISHLCEHDKFARFFFPLWLWDDIYLVGYFLGETSSTCLSANHDLVVWVIKRHLPWVRQIIQRCCFLPVLEPQWGKFLPTLLPGSPFKTQRVHNSPEALFMAQPAFSLFKG